MRKLLFTLMCLASTAAMSAAVYKWVDAQGVTHYSDQPHPGAEKKEFDSLPTYQETQPAYAPPQSGEPRQEGSPYQFCSISQPTNDEVLFNVQSVSVQLNIVPADSNDPVSIQMDGRQLAEVTPSTGSYTISPIDRGTHTLTLVIKDSQGKTLCTSPSVTFHVRQPSVKAPNAANRPRF